MSANATPATELLRRQGVDHRVHLYDAPARHGRERDARPEYGIEAASALGVDPRQMFKTLVARVDDRLVLAVVPVDCQLDLKRLAAAMGGRRADLAEPAEAERATGSVVGGISPLGGRRRLPVIVHASASDHATVFVSGGRRGLQVELAPDELVRLAAATVAPIARPG
jgi:Cys-tRNA(Pro)/Cys-tRNA(Cys) deacylase